MGGRIPAVNLAIGECLDLSSYYIREEVCVSSTS